MDQQIILTPISMTVINTPLLNYFRTRLSSDFSEAEAEQIISYEHHYMTRMDEPRSSTPAELEQAVDTVIHPLLGIYEGLKSLGYPHVYSMEVLMRYWNEAPIALKQCGSGEQNSGE